MNFHINLFSTNEVKPSKLIIRWSNTGISNIFPASINFFVIDISSLDGSVLPDG